MEKDKCLTCRHNQALTSGGDMDCEYACVGVEETDGAGAVLECSDYSRAEGINNDAGENCLNCTHRDVCLMRSMAIFQMFIVTGRYDEVRTAQETLNIRPTCANWREDNNGLTD